MKKRWLASMVLLGLLLSLLSVLGGRLAQPVSAGTSPWAVQGLRVDAWRTYPFPQGPEPPTPTPALRMQVSLSAKDDGRQIELTEGQVLVISLEGNPSTGYLWEMLEGSEKIIRQVGEIEFQPESGLLGGPVKQIIRFQAMGAGQVALKLVYRRPWEEGAQPVKAFSIGVQAVGPFTAIESDSTIPATPTPEPSMGSPAPIADQSELGLPTAFNWCDEGGCTPVRDQGSCGSCWAFGTVGPLESNIKIHDALQRNLSEQYLVSCNMDGWGCGGGWWAHDYHLNEVPSDEPDAGAVYESNFPYTAADDPCNPPHAHHEKIDSWAFVGSEYGIPSVGKIKRAIYDHGPVSVAVCVGPQFQSYTGGVFKKDEWLSCFPYVVNHAVVLVGWDDTQGTNGVWILRNSWGAEWGKNGYMCIGYEISNVGFSANYIVYSAAPSPTPTPEPGANLLSNPSFEAGGRIPTSWQGRKLTLNDKRVCTTAHDGSCSFLIVGTTANKSLRQVLSISGVAGDSFTLSGWSRAQNPLSSGGAYCLEAKVFHTDGTRKTYKACFSKSTHGWQYREKAFTTEKDYSKIVVYLRYARQGGKAWFDEVRLVGP